MHLPHIVKQIADTDTIRLITKLILIRFHGTSSIKPLTPEQWVGPTRYQAVTLFMSVQLDTINYTTILGKCQVYFSTTNPTPAYIPQAKAWDLGGKIDNAQEGHKRYVERKTI